MTSKLSLAILKTQILDVHTAFKEFQESHTHLSINVVENEDYSTLLMNDLVLIDQNMARQRILLGEMIIKVNALVNILNNNAK
ncbi:MAG: hypothetical protein LC105_05330 [Chitinophagales bacterium]|nr:hypothetical protein [Chitinophagales bacterium]